MSQEARQSREIVNTLFLKLSRGEQVPNDEVKKAQQFYNSLVLELDTCRDISDFNVSLGGGQNTNDKNMKELSELKRAYEELQNSHKILGQELQHYKSREGQERNHSEKTWGQLIEEKKALQREIEQLKKDNDILSQELNYYNSNKQVRQSNVVQVDKDCNTDSSMNYNKHQLEVEQLRNVIDEMKKELHKAKEKHNGRSSLEDQGKGSLMKQGPEQILSRGMERLRQQNHHLVNENGKLTEQIDELRNRLSMLAGHKLTAGNPDIADLSDPYRPTNIAERFRQLYDDEWTPAFEELERTVTNNEEEQIDILATIVKDVDQFCSRAQTQQFDRLKYYAKTTILDPGFQVDQQSQDQLKGDLEKGMSKTQEDLADKLLKDFRKSLGIQSKIPLRKIFFKLHMSPFMWKNKEIHSSKSLNDFAEKTLDLIWMMKIQDPPMEFTWCKSGDQFNKNMYNHYTKRGNTVSQCVWPAVSLHKEGPLMSKGVVQGR